MPKKKTDSIDREVFSARIDKKLAKEIKRIAFEKDKDIYIVVEEAFRDYIRKQSTRTP